MMSAREGEGEGRVCALFHCFGMEKNKEERFYFFLKLLMKR
jgi:hypothetical protein